jgi:hypothetical protein
LNFVQDHSLEGNIQRAEENMTIPNTDVTGGQGGTKERLGVGERQAAV